MKFFVAASAAVMACSSFASATVFKGVLNGQNKAWFNGADMCADNINLDGNICDTAWTLDNIGSFQFVGCGSPNFVLFKDGDFNSVCHFSPDTIRCPQGLLKQEWVC